MMKYVILIPSFNDWDCLNLLIPKIDQTLKNVIEEVSILVVNDGSTKKNNLSFKKNINLKKIEVLNLKNNVKAQIAIATGLGFLRKEKFDGGIIVMDADGQDDPQQLISIIEESKKDPEKTITINRNKREDGLLFKILYLTYLFLTFLLTFKYLKFGVFSYLHSSSIDRILSTDDVYMAYVGGIAKHFTNRKVIYVPRKKRITGESQNNYKSLIYYGLKTISVFRFQALINSIILIFVGFLLTHFIMYRPFFLFSLASLILINAIIFIMPYKINKSLIEDPLSNVENLENLSE